MNIIADYIWNIFQSSGKKHLLIIGSSHRGKSYVFHQIKDYIDKKSAVLTSYKKDSFVYMSDGVLHEKIGSKCDDELYYGNPMKLVKDGFYKVGIPFIKECIEHREYVFIDEIGFLESEEIEFLDVITEAMDKIRMLGVIRKQDIPFLNELKSRNDVYVCDLDCLSHHFGCIIMASGKSQRYGRNKLFECFQGQSFFEHVLDISEDLFFHRIVVTRDKDVKELCEQKGIEVYYHDYPYRNQAIQLGIKKMNDVDNCMFIPCDQPLLSRDSLIKMLKKAIDYNGIIRLSYKQQEGSPVLFDKRYFLELSELPEKKGGQYVMSHHKDDVYNVECSSKWELFDVDTQDDYKKLCDL